MSNLVGVVGAGTMGVGVSHAFARGGFPVVLVDRHQEALATARSRLAHDARYHGLLRTPAAGATADEVQAAITFTTDHSALAEAGLVVENITEDWPAKRALYQSLAHVCRPDCVLGVNTSAIPVTKVAGSTSHPARVIGTHFMNPAHLMPLVEVVRGVHTSDATVARVRELLTAIGKDSLVVNDSPGFVTNRVLMLTVNEAIFLLHEGVSTAADIDQLFRRCCGHRMGPLETADLIGLDTVLYSLEVLLENLNDPKYRPCPLLRRYVDAGWLGRKTGSGFHQYHDPASPTEEANE